MLLDSLLSSCPTFCHFPHFPQMDCALSGADSLMGGLMCVLGSSPMDSPVRLGVSATAATSIGFYSQKFRGFNFLCWNSGLHSLYHSSVVSPGLPTCQCRTSSLPATPLPAPDHQQPPWQVPSPPQLSVSAPATSLDECFFFNSFIIRLPYSLIFRQFWLFFYF